MGLGMGLTSTVYAPYCLSIGMTLPEIALINAVFFLVIVLGELPTGMLADGRSRVWSLRIGAALGAVSHIVYAFVHGFWGALACETVMGVGFAFMSGADQAWVTDALAKRGESGNLRKVLATSAIWNAASCVCGGVIGAFVASASLRAAMLAAGIACLAPLAVTARFMNGDGEPAERVNEIEALRLSFGALRRGSGLVWAMIAACSFGLVLSFNHYWAPFFTRMTGQSGLSLVWLVIYCGSMLGGLLIRRGLWREGNEASGVAAATAIMGIGLAGAGAAGGLASSFLFAFVHEVGRGAFKPLLDTFVQKRVESAYRATYGSLQSFVSRLGYAAILFCVWVCSVGYEADPRLISVTWLMNGALMVLVAAALWVFRPKRS